MELREAIRRRAMIRSFSPQAVEPAIVDRIVQDALRSPTAGNTRGTAWVVLEGPDQTAVYFDATVDAAWRESSARWDGLRRAPVILLAYASAEAYVERYREPDKAGSDVGLGLGDGAERWPVPYWTGDAAFGVMAVLLGAVDAGLGACVLGSFRGEAELAARLGVPGEWRLFCAVALGHPDGGDHRSPSLDRPGPATADRIRRGGWMAPPSAP
jgi:nitroreductase